MLLKVCGSTTREDVSLLARTPADWVGLWYGVSGGRADLDRSRLAALATAARDEGITPVIVTLLDDPERLAQAVAESGAVHVQLHGFLPPPRLALLRTALPDATLVKVLHVGRGRVLEHNWVPAYQDCGADIFLFDSLAADGQVGSTGTPLDGGAVTATLDRLERPFLLAGGLSTAPAAYQDLMTRPGFLGIDIDTAARDDKGRYDPVRVTRTSRAWRQEYERGRAG